MSDIHKKTEKNGQADMRNSYYFRTHLKNGIYMILVQICIFPIQNPSELSKMSQQISIKKCMIFQILNK